MPRRRLLSSSEVKGRRERRAEGVKDLMPRFWRVDVGMTWDFDFEFVDEGGTSLGVGG
jgi:hypothetical protein